MRTMILRTLGVTMTAATLLSGFLPECRGQATANLSWNAVTNGWLAGYYLSWGTSSNIYTATNIIPPAQTNGTITNLNYGTVYYIGVAAFASNGLISAFSTPVTFSSNAPASTPTNSNPVANNNPTPPASSGPPPPPTTTTKPGAPKAPGSGTGTGTGTSSGSATAASASSSSSSTNLVAAQIWGVPPLLQLTLSNHLPSLAIGGTVGASMVVQVTTNLKSFSWTTITNLTLTNPAPNATQAVPGQPQDALDLAFVPAVASIPVPAMPKMTTNSMGQFYRIYMPYDYAILASITLPPQGYTARLIMVNLPGLTDDGCYVGQAGSFIHYVSTNSSFQLEQSGSTVRQIATTLANNLNMDWTTASEFVYSNGMGQILATVVEADPASSDPVAGTTPTSSININF